MEKNAGSKMKGKCEHRGLRNRYSNDKKDKPQTQIDHTKSRVDDTDNLGNRAVTKKTDMQIKYEIQINSKHFLGQDEVHWNLTDVETDGKEFAAMIMSNRADDEAAVIICVT